MSIRENAANKLAALKENVQLAALFDADVAYHAKKLREWNDILEAAMNGHTIEYNHKTKGWVTRRRNANFVSSPGRYRVRT